MGGGKRIAAVGLAGCGVVEVVGSFVFAPGTGIRVSLDTETLVHVDIRYGSGTGKNAPIRPAVRRREGDAVGV